MLCHLPLRLASSCMICAQCNCQAPMPFLYNGYLSEYSKIYGENTTRFHSNTSINLMIEAQLQPTMCQNMRLQN